MKTDESLTTKLREKGISNGADLFGVAPVTGFLNSEYTGGMPQEVMDSSHSVIVIGVALLQGSIESLPKGRAEYTNSLMAATVRLRSISYILARWLEDEGYLATIVPAEGSEFGYWYADRDTLKAGLSLRYAAYLAGLGQYGLNQNLITDDYGPRVRFMGIITNAVLEPTGEKRELLSDKCSNCQECIQACPVGALTPFGEIDRRLCMEYMFTELGGLRCGMCIRACPIKRPPNSKQNVS